MEIDLEEVKEQIDLLFNPEPDEDGPPMLEFPHPRLEKVHKLDFSYMRTFAWEGSTTHQYTRSRGADEDEIVHLTRNSDMPERLMFSALQLFGDSIISYYDEEEEKREGDIRYYPAIVLTFWSGFETFVRYSSELLLLTVPNIPVPVVNFLRETEIFVGPRGSLKARSKYQSVLDRYSVFIHYAYKHNVDKGTKFWQELERAKTLRDYYTHLDINEPRSITTKDVSRFIEAILLGLIWPSSILQRSFLLRQYFLYGIWAELQQYVEEYRERPFFLDWHLKEPVMFHCNYEGVDSTRFPSVRDEKYYELVKGQIEQYRKTQKE